MKLFDQDLEREYLEGKKEPKADMFCKSGVFDDWHNREVLDHKDFETDAKKYTDGSKILFTYGEHEQRLKNDGYERAMSPQELFALLIAYEANLPTGPHDNFVIEDMIDGRNEWLCSAVKRSGDYLRVYEYATGLLWGGTNSYGVPKSAVSCWYNVHHEYEIKGIDDDWTSLNEMNTICPELIEHLCGLPYERLPASMKEESGKVKFHFDDDSKIWPLAFGKALSQYLLSSGIVSNASRGVRRI